MTSKFDLETLELLHDLSGELIGYKKLTPNDLLPETALMNLPENIRETAGAKASGIINSEIETLIKSTEKKLANVIKSITEGL